MSDVTTRSQAWAVEVESVEGTYVAPTGAGSYVQTLADGAEIQKSKEVIERNIFTGSLGQVAPRTGMFTAGGTIPVEMRAATTEGTAPEADKLFKSALGKKTTRIADLTIVGSTTSVLNVTDAAIYEVGQTVLVDKKHLSPITAINTVSDTITLLIPMAIAPAAGVSIAASTTYSVAESGHDPLSVTRYYEKKIRQYIVGAKVNSMALEGFSVGQVPSFSFGLEGLNFDSDLHTQAHNPSYSAQLPPIILGACVYMDGVNISINDFTVGMENTLAYKTSTCAPNGRMASRVGERSFSGTINPYMADDSVANFTKFKAGTPFSIFATACLPGTNPGEKKAVVCIYLPNCVATEMSDTDANGLIQETIGFSANRGDGTKDEFFISFI